MKKKSFKLLKVYAFIKHNLKLHPIFSFYAAQLKKLERSYCNLHMYSYV